MVADHGLGMQVPEVSSELCILGSSLVIPSGFHFIQQTFDIAACRIPKSP